MELKSSQSHAFTLTKVDLSLSVGHYQTETSLWGPGPSPPPGLDRLLIDVYRSRAWSNQEKPIEFAWLR